MTILFQSYITEIQFSMRGGSCARAFQRAYLMRMSSHAHIIRGKSLIYIEKLKHFNDASAARDASTFSGSYKRPTSDMARAMTTGQTRLIFDEFVRARVCHISSQYLI